METIDIKTSELTGVALDWAVSIAEGHHYDIVDGQVVTGREVPITSGEFAGCMCDEVYSPSTDWAQGGPIIEREGITVSKEDSSWSAYFRDNLFEEDGSEFWSVGQTPPIAAMRCYVASKLGDSMSIPVELL